MRRHPDAGRGRALDRRPAQANRNQAGGHDAVLSRQNTVSAAWMAEYQRGRTIGRGVGDAPHRAGPGWIVRAPPTTCTCSCGVTLPELTDVELLNRTAQRRGDGADAAAGQDRLLDQLLRSAADRCSDLAHAGLARNQHDPRPARVGLQPARTASDRTGARTWRGKRDRGRIFARSDAFSRRGRMHTSRAAAA